MRRRCERLGIASARRRGRRPRRPARSDAWAACPRRLRGGLARGPAGGGRAPERVRRAPLAACVERRRLRKRRRWAPGARPNARGLAGDDCQAHDDRPARLRMRRGGKRGAPPAWFAGARPAGAPLGDRDRSWGRRPWPASEPVRLRLARRAGGSRGVLLGFPYRHGRCRLGEPGDLSRELHAPARSQAASRSRAPCTRDRHRGGPTQAVQHAPLRAGHRSGARQGGSRW